MSTRLSGLRRLLLALALSCLPCAAVAQYKLVTGAPKGAFSMADPSPRILRQRAVSLDLPAAANAASEARATLQVAFFEDAVYTVLLKRTELLQVGGVAYSGEVVGFPQSVVVMVNNAGTVSLRVQVPGRRFSIRGSAETGYLAREHVDADKPEHDPKYKRQPPLGVNEVPQSVLKSKVVEAPPPPAADDGTSIDVLVLYTQAARAAAGGTAQMNVEAAAEVTQTNTYYANSNVVQRLRLVYAGEVTHTEVDMDTDLPRLRSGTDGFADEAPILRDLYKADFVSLWGMYNDYCGLGFLMVNESSNFAGSAYNIVSYDCTGPGGRTFAHELGHNMGLRHDNYQDPTPTTNVTPEAGGAAVDITYAHGHVDLVNRFRTIMSYNDQCAAQAPPFNCFSIPHFSNPAINFTNTAFYPSAVSAPTGNAANANERQALNDTRETTANFRQPQLTTFTGPGQILFMTQTVSVAEGGGSAVLKVGRHLGSTGSISVSYTTTGGTAMSNVDYSATAGVLTWTAGDTADKTITVPIAQDSALEGQEAFTVTLSAPTGGAVLVTGATVATVRILDDEPDTFPVGGALPAGYTSPNTPNTNMSNSQWTVDTTQGYLSTQSLQSAQALSPTTTLTDFGNSDLEYTGNFSAGTVTFYYKLSSYHSNLAGFEFQVDGVAVFSNNVGGEVDWTLVSVPLTAGQHTLRWRFKNKLSFPCGPGVSPPPPGGDNCANRAWIDSISLPTLQVPPANPPRMVNLSTRMKVGTGFDVLIGGFVITGGSKNVAVVATGPSLGNFGIANHLPNPKLTLVRQSNGATIATNDDWNAGCPGGFVCGTPQQLTAANLAPSHPLEPAILINLPPGAYTAIVEGVAGGTGVSVVAVYEVDGPTIPLANIATRGKVGTGFDVMIGGFVISGTGPQRVAIVATGPSLGNFGITNHLPNPTLRLVRQSDGVVLGSNDDWQAGCPAGMACEPSSQLTAANLAPSNPLEAGILITLNPGAYTAIVEGVGGGTGIAVIGVYKVN